MRPSPSPSFRAPMLPLLMLGLVAGCASSTPTLSGPSGLCPVKVEPARYEGQAAHRVVTDHYQIDTTIADTDFDASLGQLMEGALAQYHRLAPGVALTSIPMQCHMFAYRSQWAGFTKHTAGPDAEVYLQINRGGYTAGDVYVAYFIGDVGTWSVASHEGWHQFVARHFAKRPPPFLEEGLACMFENVRWDGGLPRWDLESNAIRLTGVRKTLQKRALVPLDQLCTMHAGQVVNTSSARIEGFYAQSWAFARFLCEGEGGRYRPALQALLSDLAAGHPAVPVTLVSAGHGWDPRSAKPLLEHYLGSDLASIEHAYIAYMRQISGETAHAGEE